MHYFKFMQSAHVDDACAPTASLLFSDLKYFRLLELANESAWIGDVNEGVAPAGHCKLEKLDVGAEGGERTETLLERKGLIRISNSSSIGVDLTVISRVNCHILSFSRGRLAPLRAIMCLPPGTYDACFRISDIRKFVDCLWQTGRFAPLKNRSLGQYRPLSDCFTKPEWGMVSYTPASEPPTDGSYEQASPFIKHPKFSNQAEARIVLSPKSGAIIPGRIVVRFDNEGPILKKEFGFSAKSGQSMSEQAYDRLEYDLQIIPKHVCPTASSDEIARALRRLLEIYLGSLRDNALPNHFLDAQFFSLLTYRRECRNLRKSDFDGIVSDMRALLRPLSSA